MSSCGTAEGMGEVVRRSLAALLRAWEKWQEVTCGTSDGGVGVTCGR